MFIKVKNLDDKFSTGGMWVTFTKKGKTWSTLGYLKRHFSQHKDDALLKIYADCVLITVDEDSMDKTIEPLRPILIEYIKTRKVSDADKAVASLKARKASCEYKVEKLQEEIKQLELEIKG